MVTQFEIALSDALGVISPNTRFVYDTAKYVGEGALGLIYLARREDETAYNYVVKISHQDSASGSSELEAEYRTLAAIHNHVPRGAEVMVPPAGLGYGVLDHHTALVMPYYSKTLKAVLSDSIGQADALNTERLALRALLGFANVMSALRQSGSTCTDRKGKDFFVYTGQPIVIDWNILKPLGLEFYAAELQLFARIWLELLTEQNTPPNFDPFDDSIWQHALLSPIPGGVISVGFRLAMVASLELPPGERYANRQREPDYAVLYSTMSRWKAVIDANPDETPDQLEAKINQYVDMLPWQAIPDAYRQAISTDARWRLLLPRNETAAAALQEAYAARADSLREAGLVRAARKLNYANLDDEEIVRAVLEGSTQAARRITERQLENAQRVGDLEIVGHRRRWRHLLDILDQLLTVRAETRQNIRDSLMKVGAQLSAPPQNDTREGLSSLENELAQLRDTFQSATGSAATLDVVAAEISLRKEAIRFRSNDNLRLRMAEVPGLFARLNSVTYLASDADDGAGSSIARQMSRPLAAQIIPTGFLLQRIKTLIDNDTDPLRQPMTLENYENLLEAYRLTSVLGEADPIWLDSEIEAYLLFTRFMIAAGKTPPQDLPFSARNVLKQAQALFNQPRIARSPNLRLVVQSEIVRHVSALFESLGSVLRSRKRREAAQFAAITRSFVPDGALREVIDAAYENTGASLNEPETYTAWIALVRRAESIEALHEFYEEWHAATYGLSLELSVGEARNVPLTYEQVRIITELVARAKTVGADMSEMIGADRDNSAEQWRELIERLVRQVAESAQQAREYANEAADNAKTALNQIDEHNLRIADFGETIDAVGQDVRAHIEQLEQDRYAFQQEQRAQVRDEVQAGLSEERGRLAKDISQQALSYVTRQITDINDHFLRLDQNVSSIDRRVDALRQTTERSFKALGQEFLSHDDGAHLTQGLEEQRNHLSALDQRMTGEIKALKIAPLLSQLAAWEAHRPGTVEKLDEALRNVSSAMVRTPDDVLTYSLYDRWSQLMRSLVQTAERLVTQRETRGRINADYLDQMRRWVEDQIVRAERRIRPENKRS